MLHGLVVAIVSLAGVEGLFLLSLVLNLWPFNKIKKREEEVDHG